MVCYILKLYCIVIIYRLFYSGILYSAVVFKKNILQYLIFSLHHWL